MPAARRHGQPVAPVTSSAGERLEISAISPHRSPVLKYATAVLQLLVVAGAVAWALDLPGKLDFSLYTEQLLIAALGACLSLTFLTVDRHERTRPRRPRWYDLVLASLSLVVCGYLSARYPDLVREIVYRPLDAVIASGLLAGLVLEAVRRVAGLVLVAVVAFFVAYAMLGHLLPAAFAARPVEITRLLVYLGVDTSGIIGSPLAVAVVVIVPFLLLGRLLSCSGGSDFFTSLSLALMGRYRGGGAKIAVIGSTFFGAISGSAVANVASTGIITIPLMRRSGWPGPVAGGVEAVASTGGQLAPPVMGASAFLMAEFLQVSYVQILLAAIIPTVLYYLALFIQVDLRAARLGLDRIPEDRIPDTLRVLRDGWYFLLPFVVFLGALIWLNMRPELAVLLACVLLALGAVTFGYRGMRTSFRSLWDAFLETGHAAIEIVVICAAAGLVIGILNLTGLAFGLSMQLVALSGEFLPLLLILAACISVVLGMGMPTVGVYVLLAALVAPALTRAGVEPLVAHFFILYFGMMSMVTPPIALAAFTAANIAESEFWSTAWKAVQLGWSAYIIPFLFVASPTLLMVGSPVDVAWAVVTAVIGIYFISMAIAGFFRARIGWMTRFVSAAAGLLLLTPRGAWSGAIYGEIAGFVVASILLLTHTLGPRPGKALGRNPQELPPVVND